MRELYPQQICSACYKRIRNSRRKVKNFTKYDTVKNAARKVDKRNNKLDKCPYLLLFYVPSADFEHCWAHSNLSVTLHSTETYATVVRFHPDGTPISPHEKLSKPNEIEWGSTRVSNTHMDTHFSIILRATKNTNV